MLEKILQLHSAYGRTNKTIKSVKNDFNSGLDFNSRRGYMSIRDLSAIKAANFHTVYYDMGSSTVYMIRFGEIQKWVKV